VANDKAVKVTLFANFNSSGFSESYYYNQDSLDGGSIQVDVDALISARTGLYGDETVFMGYRLTETQAPQRSKLVLADNTEGHFVVNDNDTITNAWLVLCTTAALKSKRQLWLRGAPDIDVVWSQPQARFPQQPLFVRAFDAFQRQLVGKAKWAMQTILPLKDPASGAKQANSLQTNALNQLTITTAGAVTPAALGSIIVSGFTKPYGYLNGTYTYKQFSIAGNVITLYVVVSPLVILQPPQKVWVRPRTVAYNIINAATPEFPRSRRCGRAFFVARGRRSGRPR